MCIKNFEFYFLIIEMSHKIDKFVRNSLREYISENGIVGLIMEYIDYEAEFEGRHSLLDCITNSLFRNRFYNMKNYNDCLIFIPCHDELNALCLYSMKKNKSNESSLAQDLFTMMYDYKINGFSPYVFRNYFIREYGNLIIDVKYDGENCKKIYLVDAVKIIDVYKIRKEFLKSINRPIIRACFPKSGGNEKVIRYMCEWRSGHIWTEYSCMRGFRCCVLHRYI